MKLIIHTVRHFQTWPSFHLVYEWEDLIQSEFKDSAFHHVSRLYNKIIRIASQMNLRGRAFSRDSLNFCFEMGAKTNSDFYNRRNVIPSVIDFFLSEDEIAKFEQAHLYNPVVLISSREAYEYLEQKNLKINIAHWPLSLPDKYQIPDGKLYLKKYDFVLVGRQNPVLKEFLDQYAATHPDLTYVFEGKEKFHYHTNKGEYVGYFKSREEYIRLARLSRIALYSTPSMDGSRTGTNGFNQVTPKFLEYIACECHLILRYEDNPDTRYYELESFCPNIETYEQFTNRVDEYRKVAPDIRVYSRYLSRHYTSVRAGELKLLLNKIYKNEFQ